MKDIFIYIGHAMFYVFIIVAHSVAQHFGFAGTVIGGIIITLLMLIHIPYVKHFFTKEHIESE